jgi:hypothetical protein
MSRVLLLMISALLIVSSCEPGDPPDYTEHEEIRDINWLPGDSLLAALVSVPLSDGNRSTLFRTYDLSGSIRQEFSLTNDPYADNLHVTQDGQRAIFSSNGSIFVLDIPSQTSSIIFSNTRLISAAPDQDVYVIFRNEDNPTFNSIEVYARTTFDGASLVIDTFLRITSSGFSFTPEFPLLLSGGRLACLEFDTASSSVMKIRDSLLAVTNAFHLPTSLFFANVAVPRTGKNFYFVSFGMRAQLSRFRTDVGFIDPIHDLYDSYSHYTILSAGQKVIFKSGAEDNYIIKDVITSMETAIPNTEKATALYVSSNDKLLAVILDTDDGDALMTFTLP